MMNRYISAFLVFAFAFLSLNNEVFALPTGPERVEIKKRFLPHMMKFVTRPVDSMLTANARNMNVVKNVVRRRSAPRAAAAAAKSPSSRPAPLPAGSNTAKSTLTDKRALPSSSSGSLNGKSLKLGKDEKLPPSPFLGSSKKAANPVKPVPVTAKQTSDKTISRKKAAAIAAGTAVGGAALAGGITAGVMASENNKEPPRDPRNITPMSPGSSPGLRSVGFPTTQIE